MFVGKLAKNSFSVDELERFQAIIEENLNNCFFYFQPISDEAKFNALVNVCDVLFVVYKEYPFSSSILTKVAIFKKVIISSNSFCIGEIVRRFRLGITVPENDVSAIAQAVNELSDRSRLNACWKQADFEDYEAR